MYRLLYVLMAIIQFSFAFHALKTGRGAKWIMIIILAPVVALIIFMGVYPQPFLSRVKPSVDLTLKRVFAVQGMPTAVNNTAGGEAKNDGR